MVTILHTEWSKGWGGQEIRIIQDSLEFIKRGYRVMILCQPGSRIYNAAEENDIPVIPLMMRSGLDPMAIRKCLQIIKKNSVDLVHTHSSVDSWCCSIAANILGVPVVRSRHISAPISTNYLSFLLYMKLAARVISSGEIIKEKMVEINGYDPQRIISIPTGVYEEWFSQKISGEGIRKEFNIGEKDFLLGIVAILRSWKGHFYLLEAVKCLRETIPHLKLLIVGDGPQERAIGEYLVNNGLTNKVIMTGYRRDIPQILKSLDLFVLPSYANEGAPQVILQAMATGIPVLSALAGGIEEIVKNGQTGILVPPRDIQALGEAIEWIYQNKEESLKMAQNARQYVLDQFIVQGLTDKTEEVYRDVLQKHSYKKVKILPARVSPIHYKFFRRPPWEYFFKMRHRVSSRWASLLFIHSHSLSKVKSRKL